MEIGVVGRAHGITGAVNVFLYNTDSSILNTLKKIFLQDSKGIRGLTLVEVRRSQKKHIARFEGVNTREAADDLKGAKLSVPRSSLPRLEEDEFYVADLIGAEAFDGDRRLGIVTAARPQGEIEVVTVTSDTHTFEVPLVEDFVISVDCDEGRLMLTDTHLLPVYPRKRPPKPKKR